MSPSSYTGFKTARSAWWKLIWWKIIIWNRLAVVIKSFYKNKYLGTYWHWRWQLDKPLFSNLFWKYRPTPRLRLSLQVPPIFSERLKFCSSREWVQWYEFIDHWLICLSNNAIASAKNENVYSYNKKHKGWHFTFYGVRFYVKRKKKIIYVFVYLKLFYGFYIYAYVYVFSFWHLFKFWILRFLSRKIKKKGEI